MAPKHWNNQYLKRKVEAIRNAYAHGCTFFDTAEVYSPNLSGTGHNERIVGKALRDVRGNVVLATKLFLNRMEPGIGGSVYKAVRRHLESSMKRLQTDTVDLYYLHRTSLLWRNTGHGGAGISTITCMWMPRSRSIRRYMRWLRRK